MMKNIFLAAAAFLLAACAATQPVGRQMGQIRQAVVAKGQVVDQMLFVRVPSPGNPVSEGMMLAALAAGTQSNAVKGITEILTARPNAPLGIVGNSRAVNVATLKRALADLPAVPAAREYAVYLDASPADLAALQQAAAGKNIRIFGLQ
ncbi:hypothetical protein [Neisseria leonii]|uniref:hypothetical protein n=1 Tax=Neisseria leonii TaxID=2995413 RepID=UPI00237C0FF4|nr:hypothetical protein [Neisseria sp. 3986]MDD9326312.1 hypothetical protein [Neisseria sp. 3986]